MYLLTLNLRSLKASLYCNAAYISVIHRKEPLVADFCFVHHSANMQVVQLAKCIRYTSLVTYVHFSTDLLYIGNSQTRVRRSAVVREASKDTLHSICGHVTKHPRNCQKRSADPKPVMMPDVIPCTIKQGCNIVRAVLGIVGILPLWDYDYRVESVGRLQIIRTWTFCGQNADVP